MTPIFNGLWGSTTQATAAAAATLSPQDLEARFEELTKLKDISTRDQKEICSLAGALGQTIGDVHRLIHLLRLADTTRCSALKQSCQAYVGAHPKESASLLFLLIIERDFSLVHQVLNWPPVLLSPLLSYKDTCNQSSYQKLKETGQLAMAKEYVGAAHKAKVLQEAVGDVSEERE